MSDIEIRLARPEEYARIGEITVTAYVASGLMAADSPYVPDLRDAASRAARTDLLVAALAGSGDESLLGSVTYCPPGSTYAEVAGPGEAEFRMLAVSPDARGLGAGSALVQACVDRAGDAGARALRLSTQPNMRTAHRIYERFGFSRTPSRDWSPAPGVNLLTYALTLPRS